MHALATFNFMIQLHPLWRTGAIFQADRPVVVSGYADPGAAVSIRFGNHRAETVATADGKWACSFPPFPAGARAELAVRSGNEGADAADLLAGDVWLCSGQSNMEWQLELLPHAKGDIESANDPALRFFTVERANEREPITTADGRWRPGTAEHVGACSAVAWYFARRVREATGRPIGLVVSAWGGTSILAWMPLPVLGSRPEYAAYLAEFEAAGPKHERVNMSPHDFFPTRPHCLLWKERNFDDSHWSTLNVPGTWQQQGWTFNGPVWYRARIRLPEEWRNRRLTLNLGVIDDFDEAFVNGERVGGLGPERPDAYKTTRLYDVPGHLTADGELVIAVRVFDHWGEGGIMTAGSLYPKEAPESAIPLPNIWRAQAEEQLRWRTGALTLAPSELYNGMIHPLTGYPLRGVLWYQGESDVSRAQRYRLLLPDLIAAWRKAWGDPKLPFGLVQLAGYQPPREEPGESDWAELREAQWLAFERVSGVGLISAVDLGDPMNIHPEHKKPVGERLANWALSESYGLPGFRWRHPIVRSAEIAPPAVYIYVACAQGVLRAADEAPLRGFQIAGADRRWRWAQARFVGPATVEVSHPEVPAPAAVRYGWQGYPNGNIVDADGLPLLPFRTDEWPLTTL